MPDRQKSFARHFGELHINDFIPKLAGHVEIQIIAREAHQKKNAGSTWHSDVTYKRKAGTWIHTVCEGIAALLRGYNVCEYISRI